MLKILSDYLVVKDNLLYYQKTLFSGLCIEIDDQGIVYGLNLYKDGEEVSEYHHKYWGLSEYKKVDSDLLEYRQEDNNENQKVFLNDSEFSGIAYSFQHGVCTEEVLYINGYLKTEFIYFKNGEIAEINSQKDEFNYIRTIFSEKCQLLELKIEGCFYSEREEDSEVKSFPDKEFFLDVESSHTLILKGENIDDELFKNIFSNNGMKKLKKIILERTSVSKNNLEKLETLNNFEILFNDGVETISKRAIEEKDETKNNIDILFAFLAVIVALFSKLPLIFSEINSFDFDHAGAQTIVLFSFFIIISCISLKFNERLSKIVFIVGTIICNIILIYILIKTAGGFDFGDILGMLMLINAISVGMMSFLILQNSNKT